MNSLVTPGFSQPEAAIYVYPPEESPASGDQIAETIEILNANTSQVS